MPAYELPICIVAADANLPLQADVANWRIRTIESLAQMHHELVVLANRGPSGTRTLDLIGHSTRDHHFLRVGETAVDMERRAVSRIFEAVASEGLLEAVGIAAIRLLGCSTAVTLTGQRTMRRLSRVVGLPVYGATKTLLPSHYTPDGFNPTFDGILVEASQAQSAGLRPSP